MRNLFLAVASLTVASPALAQSTDAAPPPPSALPDPNDQSDQFTILAGGALMPDYSGSDDYVLRPAAIVRGRDTRDQSTHLSRRSARPSA